ncbi:hypothetical protein AB0O90_04450 [Microbacterium testaceum]|uniref:hypothetical protein n=1 Tax=Microbacterium testaceum TaxID=2033 RepID=UPI00344A2841
MRTAEELRSVLTDAINKHDASVNRHRERVSSGLITAAGYTEAVRADANTAGSEAAVRGVLAELDERETAAQAAVDRERARVTEPTSGTATEQLLAENRAVRAWERLRTRLSAGNPIMAAQDGLRAISEATGDERRVIVEELPAYVIGLGQQPVTPAQIDRAIAESDEAYAAALVFSGETDTAVSILRTKAQSALTIVQSEQLSGSRGDIVIRDGHVRDFPTAPSRPDTRTPEQRAAFEKALNAVLSSR